MLSHARKPALLLLAIFCALPISAQSTAPTLHVYSRETLVDVTVTDAQGLPVRGLARSDFTIIEDGAPQSIRSFREFGTRTATAARAMPKLPPNIYTNLQPATGPLNVLLFDDLNGGDNLPVRSAAAKFIENIATGTRVALLALGARLTVLQGPTTEPAPLLKVINTFVQPLNVSPDINDPCRVQTALDWATLDQLRQLATYLSGINGKKNVIWIGNSIPDLISNGCKDWRLPLQQTYDLLGDAQITVYPFDPNGVGSLGEIQLAMEAVAQATGGVAYYERNDLDKMLTAAADSGASYYTLSYSPPSIAYDGRYHAISIEVDKPGLHLVYRKGYSAEDPKQIALRHENPFGITTRDTKPSAPAPDPLTAAMAPFVPAATQLLFDVRAEPSTAPPSPADPPVLGALNPKLSKAPLTRYSFLFAVPASQIAFTAANAETYTGGLEFDLAAYDPDGRLVTSRTQTMQLPLTANEYKKFIATPFQFLQQIDLPPGQMTLRVGVLDSVSQKVGTLEIPLTVPKK